MTDAFTLLDRDFRITYMNPSAVRVTGRDAESVLGRSHWEVWPETIGTDIENFYRQAMDTGEAQHFQFHHADEQAEVWLDIHAYPGDAGLAIYFRDITERKQEQARIGRIERAYQAALSNTPDLVYVFDLNHRFSYANEALLALWGRSSEDSIGKTCLELGYPDWHAAMHDREIDQVIASKASIQGIVPFDGTQGRRLYEYIFVPVLGVDGEVESIAGTTRDVTERQHAETILRASEERLRLAIIASKLAIWDWDIATDHVTWSQDSEPVFGRPAAEMTPIGRCFESVLEEDRASTTQALQRAIEERVDYDHEFRVIWPDGSIHWLGGRGKVFYGPDERPIRVLGVCWDITTRKLAEEVLRNESGRLSDLIQQAPAFMAVLRGPDHIFEMTNSLYQELIGGRSVLNKPVREVLPEAAEQGFLALLDRVYQTGEPFLANGFPFELNRRAGGPPELRYLNFVYQPLREPDTSVSGILVHGIDVTQARKAQEALLQAEKISAAGRLAASISHEINNPLEAVTNLLYLIDTDASLSAATRSFLNSAQSELARVTHITTSTLRFYRQSTNAVVTDIRDVLESVLTLYERRLRDAAIVIERQYSSSRPRLIFEGELRQVISNLVGNALDAIGSNGRVLLRERQATQWHTGLKGLMLTIADTGQGMTRETLHRLFDAFYSTKGPTGTGLGLWVSKGIIEKHGGTIRVRSSQHPAHRGTVFSIFLPDLPAAA
jgi:PAS domain S-box-containing protein